VPAEDIADDTPYSEMSVLILKSTKDYEQALSCALEASKNLGWEFDNDQRLYSAEKGVYFSEDFPDSIYAEGYYPRRYGQALISLENSTGYEGFTPGYIIVIGGIYPDEEAAGKDLSLVQGSYPDAYIKKTSIYMGCIH